MNFEQANTQILKFQCTTEGSPNAGLGIQAGYLDWDLDTV